MNLLRVTKLVMEMEHRTTQERLGAASVQPGKEKAWESATTRQEGTENRVCRAGVNGLGKLQLDTRKKKLSWKSSNGGT